MSINAAVKTPEIGHVHRDISGGWLRAAVFGAMDGLVTNISLVAGVGGAGVSRHVILLSGLAGLVAGALSMALGEYTSVETQNNAIRAEAAAERSEMQRNPDGERAELVESYIAMGLSRQTAEQAATEIHENPELAIRVHLEQELGVNPDDQPSPVTAAVSSFLCFTIGAIVPLLSFLFGSSSLLLALVIGAIGLFAAGAVVARFTTRSWWINGTRQLAFGAIAAGATFVVGSLIGVAAS
jgi:vacuolar iron transporter family protein